MTAAKLKLEVDAVIFDLDGTLIDTVPIYYKIIDTVFERLGIPPVPKATLLFAMKDGDFDWDCVLPNGMKPRKDELIREARIVIDEIAPRLFRRQAQLIPGAAGMLKQIAVKGMRIGLVTSTPMANLAEKMTPLKTAGLDKLLAVIITTDDVHNKKPHAEPLIKCSAGLGIAPGECVYVGDTRVDIRAGRAAGMSTIGVLTGFDDYDALKKEMPDAIVASVADLGETIDMQAADSADAIN